jgi:hypothetical protein
MGFGTVSEFKDAIGWRGSDRLSFIVYGLWPIEKPVGGMERASASLTNVISGADVSIFVATEQDWPCSIGVFDIECDQWPADPEEVLRQLLAAVCSEGSVPAWMMFDGVFNSVQDIFREEWATHIYAVQWDCTANQVDLAIADEVRHSTDWAGRLRQHRERVLVLFPSLRVES